MKKMKKYTTKEILVRLGIIGLTTFCALDICYFHYGKFCPIFAGLGIGIFTMIEMIDELFDYRLVYILKGEEKC